MLLNGFSFRFLHGGYTFTDISSQIILCRFSFCPKEDSDEHLFNEARTNNFQCKQGFVDKVVFLAIHPSSKLLAKSVQPSKHYF